MANSPSKYAPPSRNPADNDTLSGLFNLVLGKFLQHTDDMLPAKVIAYDAATNNATVQPLIQVVSTDGQIVDRAQIASVPVLQLSGGGFIMKLPVRPGDLGWIKANDRDISLFKQAEDTAPPNTQRKHSFEDALFIPQAAWSLIDVATEDAGNMVLQNYAGTVKISISNNQVTITGAQVEINGVTTVNGNTTINGTLDVGGIIVGANINLSTHIHSGVQTGGGDTGPPVP